MSNYTYNPSFSTGAGANDHAHVLAPLPTNISGVQRVAHVPKRKIGDLDNEPHFANAGEVSDLFCSTTTDAKRRRLDFSNLDGDAQCSSGLEDQHNKDRDAAGHGISVMQTNLAIDLPEPSPLFPGEDEFLLDLFGDDISYGFEPGTDLTAGLELGGEEYNFDWDEFISPILTGQTSEDPEPNTPLGTGLCAPFVPAPTPAPTTATAPTAGPAPAINQDFADDDEINAYLGAVAGQLANCGVDMTEIDLQIIADLKADSESGVLASSVQLSAADLEAEWMRDPIMREILEKFPKEEQGYTTFSPDESFDATAYTQIPELWLTPPTAGSTPLPQPMPETPSSPEAYSSPKSASPKISRPKTRRSPSPRNMPSPQMISALPGASTRGPASFAFAPPIALAPAPAPMTAQFPPTVAIASEFTAAIASSCAPIAATSSAAAAPAPFPAPAPALAPAAPSASASAPTPSSTANLPAGQPPVIPVPWNDETIAANIARRKRREEGARKGWDTRNKREADARAQAAIQAGMASVPLANQVRQGTNQMPLQQTQPHPQAPQAQIHPAQGQLQVKYQHLQHPSVPMAAQVQPHPHYQYPPQHRAPSTIQGMGMGMGAGMGMEMPPYYTAAGTAPMGMPTMGVPIPPSPQVIGYGNGYGYGGVGYAAMGSGSGGGYPVVGYDNGAGGYGGMYGDWGGGFSAMGDGTGGESSAMGSGSWGMGAGSGWGVGAPM